MRRKDREVTDINEIINIVDKAKILHLGLFDGNYPYIVPLHYGYEFADKGLTDKKLTDKELIFYMHGANEGHKTDLIKNNPSVCVELECNVEQVSGEDIPCRYGSTFASVIGRGKAEIVDDEQEKIRGLNLLMENQTGRKFNIDGNMAASVTVIKVTVSEFTAKARK